MHVHGFTRSMLAKLVRAGLATAQSETGQAIAVGRIRITDAGRRWRENATNQSYGVQTGLRISGGSKRDRLTPSPTAGSRGSDPRPLGPTVGGRPDRTCGERPCAPRIATRPKVGPTNCKKNISPLHGVELVG